MSRLTLGARGEAGPAPGIGGQLRAVNWGCGAEAVQPRSLVGLQCERFQNPGVVLDSY